MIKTLVTNREWGKFSHIQVASAVKACLGRTEVAKRLLFITFAVVASFVGQTAHAQNAAWEGSTPSDANGKTVYLYNVGTKQFLGKGGRWGTEATMNVEGTPFMLTYGSGTFTLTSKVKQEGGDSNGKLTLMDGTTSTSQYDKFRYFVDGNVTAAANHTFTATGSVEEGYTLSITSASGTGSTMAGKTFYLFAEAAYGHVSPRLATATSPMLGIPADSTAYSKWVIVTEDQRKDAFKTVNNAHVAAVNATFLMSDFDFARNDNDCSAWKTGATATETATGTLSYSGNKVCKPTDAEGYTYYLGNGYDERNYTTDPITGETMTVGENRQQSYGGAWTANIHGARGSVVQTIPATNMIKEGWYRVSCVGFTTATKGIARLFAASGKGNTGSNATEQTEKFAIANLHRIDAATRPATYVAASKLLDTPNVNTLTLQ